MQQESVRSNNRTGTIFPVVGGGEGISLYNAKGGDIKLGEVVVISFGGADGQEHQAKAAATQTGFGQMTAVALEPVKDGKIGYFQFSGKCKALVTGHSSLSAAGKFLEVVNGGDGFIYDAGSRGANSGAVIMEAYTTTSQALKNVLLIPEPHKIAAS